GVEVLSGRRLNPKCAAVFTRALSYRGSRPPRALTARLKRTSRACRRPLAGYAPTARRSPRWRASVHATRQYALRPSPWPYAPTTRRRLTLWTSADPTGASLHAATWFRHSPALPALPHARMSGLRIAI